MDAMGGLCVIAGLASIVGAFGCCLAHVEDRRPGAWLLPGAAFFVLAVWSFTEATRPESMECVHAGDGYSCGVPHKDDAAALWRP